jgi:RNA polymerase sigma-70 factor, ECF subfamily
VGRDESDLLAALRAGDEAAFSRLVTEWSRPMITLARGYVSTAASAEEVVQETWLAVIKGLDRFEGRSALRTWVYRILVNIAKSRGVKEHRTLPWSTVAGEDAGPSLDPALFRDGGWRAAPAAWPDEVAVEGARCAA